MTTAETHDCIPEQGDALLIVDVQNDFLPDGNLAVPQGDDVVPVLNRYSAAFRTRHLPIFASRDWHPSNHCSFTEQGGPWSPHCVAETHGAQFASGLDLTDTTVISKATEPGSDAYSAFEKTDLDQRLKQAGVKRLFVGGLATDYCVLNSVRDAVRLNYSVVLLEDAIRAVNVQPKDGSKAIEEMLELGCQPATVACVGLTPPKTFATLTDLYQLAMLKSYHDQGMNQAAVFEFYIRNLPAQRNFLMAAGLEQVLEYLENLQFTPQERDWLKNSGRFPAEFADSLKDFRFTGNVDALPEGTVFFSNEPVLRITAPLQQAQLAETRIINILQMQTMAASKAARMVFTAPGKTLLDFGLRRSHGAEAGLFVARASYLAGFNGSATVPAEPFYGIPVFGTMAHSYIQAHSDETTAFKNFAHSWPDNTIFLLDTYDTVQAAHKVVALARDLKKEGISIHGVRLDSGDLTQLAKQVRSVLDEGGLKDTRIFASGNLDEYALEQLIAKQAPIDGFGIGTHLAVSEDAPTLECVYKMQEYDGQPQRKRSERKATWPGKKQVFRTVDAQGKIQEDHLAMEDESPPGEPLLKPCMRNGKRLSPPASLEQCRTYAARQLDQLPKALRSLKPASPYPVHISQKIRDLADRLDQRSFE
jgi:nicotinate phosphoribosyltransferase